MDTVAGDSSQSIKQKLHCVTPFSYNFFRKQSCDQIEPLCFFASCFAYIQILHGQKPYGASFRKYYSVLFQDVTFILQTGYGNSQAYQLEGVNLM